MFSTAKDNKTTMAKDSMTNEGGHINKDSMAHESDQVINDLKTAARTLHGGVHDAASSIKDDLGCAAHQTGRNVRELIDQAGQSFVDVGSAFTKKIRDNPIQSSLIALGAGLVIGMFYRR